MTEPKSTFQGDVIEDPSLLETIEQENNGDHIKEGNETGSCSRPTLPSEEQSDGWDDVLGSGSLLVKTIKSGTATKSQQIRPSKGQEVYVNIKESCIFDPLDKLDFARQDFKPPTKESHPRASVSVRPDVRGRVGEGDFITAVDMALQLMHEGDKVAIRAQARHCYGMIGKPGTFSPAADLYIELELLRIGRLRQEPQHMSFEERLSDAEAFNLKGNMSMKVSQFHEAVQFYKKALT